MKDELQTIEKEALAKIEEAADLKDLQDVQVTYLGKKGSITTVLRGMGKLSTEERPVIGEMANKVRGSIQTTLAQKKETLEMAELEVQLEKEKIDVTLPGRPMTVGGPHVLNSIIQDIEDLFIGLGFEVKEGPEVETDYYNFEA